MGKFTFSNSTQAMYLFHPRIVPTIARNYDRMKKVFKDNPDTLEVVEFIKEHDEINEASVRLFLEQTKRMDSAKEKLVAEYNSAVELPNDQVIEVIEDLQDCCYRNMINELSTLTSSPREYVKMVQEMDWTIGIDDMEHQNVEIVDIEDMKPEDPSSELGAPIKSHFDFINRATPIGGYIQGTINLIGGAPAAGKSNFAMDEFIEQIKQGLDPVYVALGDLIKLDMMTRLPAKYFNYSIDYCFLHTEEVWTAFCKDVKEKYHCRVKFLFVKPDTLTAKELLAIMERKGLIRDHKIFWFDYDNNFHSESESLFGKGDEVYQTLGYLSRLPGKTVFVLSQMKSSTWSKDLLEEEDFGESRRKPEIADMAITISRRSGTKNRVGKLNIAKIRRGIKLYANYFLDISGRFYEINDEGFNNLSNTNFFYTNVPAGYGSLNGIDYRVLDIKSDGNTGVPNEYEENKQMTAEADSKLDSLTDISLQDNPVMDAVLGIDTANPNQDVSQLVNAAVESKKEETPKQQDLDGVLEL